MRKGLAVFLQVPYKNHAPAILRIHLLQPDAKKQPSCEGCFGRMDLGGKQLVDRVDKLSQISNLKDIAAMRCVLWHVAVTVPHDGWFRV